MCLNIVMIISFDIDGTILNDDKVLTRYTLDTLRRFKDRGHFIVPCTGRNITMMESDLASKELVSYMILGNGSEIYDNINSTYLKRTYFNIEEVLSIYDKFKDKDVDFDYYEDGQAYSDAYSLAHLDEYHLPPFNQKLFLKTRKVVDDIKEDIILNKRRVSRINLVFKDLDYRRYLLDHRFEFPYNFASSIFCNGEITPLNVDKGHGLLYLAEYLDIAKDDIWFFGDSYNDESALRLDINSVLMKNGVDELKDAARYISDFTNDQDGVARFLDKMFSRQDSRSSPKYG